MLWTEAERATLRELWPTTTTSQIAMALGRSKGSVSGEIDRLKLSRPRMDGWSEADINQVSRWWPYCSASVIAHKLGRTRSAVCGKINRLRQADMAFQHKSSRVQQYQLHKPHPPRPKKSPPRLPQQPRPAIMPIQCPCQLVELEAINCKWPHGDPHQQGFYFCGAVTLNGYPYCARHHAKAHEREPHAPRRRSINSAAGP